MTGADFIRPDGVEPPQPLAAALLLRDRLREAGIRFVHWKSNGHLAEGLAGTTDIDMFADPAQRQEVRRVLRRLGALEVRSQPWSSYPDVEDWLVMDDASTSFLHIHLHFALMTGLKRVKHLRIPWGEALLASAVIDEASGWPTPSPEMELLVLLVRMWAKMPPWRRLRDPRLPRHILAEFRWLSTRADPAELVRLCRSLLPGADAGRVAALAGDPAAGETQILAVSRQLYGELHGAYRMSWRAALLRAAMLNARALAAKKLRRLIPGVVSGKTVAGRGIVVAFIGSDGSGKSTVTRDVSRWLRYKLDVHHIYLGSGDGGVRLRDRLRRFLKSSLKPARPPKAAAEKTLESFSAPRRLSFLQKLAALHHLVLARDKRTLLQRAHALADGGSIVIADRFPQSQVMGIYDGPRLQNGRGFAWAARAEMRCFADYEGLRPDLLVKLVVSPETAHARKPDHNIKAMKLKCDITRMLAFEDVNTVEINADQPVEKVLADVRSAVWRTLLSTSGQGSDGHSPT